MPKFVVYVVDAEQKPLIPTCEARARILLSKERAKVFSVAPFTIQLNRIVDSSKGEFRVGIDDGAKEVGVSVAHKDNVVFAGNIKLRQDVHKKMLQRSQYRRTRRSRNLRHRKARFLNRSKKGWLPPTIKQKKDSIIRVLIDLKKRLNIIECVVEQGQFDVSSMSRGYKLTGKEYQFSEYEGNNWRQKVLWRDKYTCQRCGFSSSLEAHHIILKSKGGTNTVTNGITLCTECHASLHKDEWVLKKKVKGFKYPTHLQQGKWYLFNKLKAMFKNTNICFGWMTAKKRRELKLPKDHHFDASAMLKAGTYSCHVFSIIPKRSKVWDANPTKTCEERNGFRHWDVLKAKHRRLGSVVGSVRSLKKKCITLRTKFDDNFPVSYNKSKLLYRPSGIVYC